MEPSDEQITTLLGMGFEDIEQIRRALAFAKNDLSDAVSYLTGEDTGMQGGFGSIVPEAEMKEPPLQRDPHAPAEGDESHAVAPPSYNESVAAAAPLSTESPDAAEYINMPLEDIPDEFPVSHLYELEDRIYSENWSIPYKRDESLGRCLLGALKLASKGMAEADIHCARFVDRALPECFQKLLAASAVRRWNQETQDGIFNMMQLFVDFIAMRLKFDPIPIKLLGILKQVFDPESEYHFKNKGCRWDRSYYEDLFGFQKCPAVSPPYSTYKEPYGLLVNAINRFAEKGGFEALTARVASCECITTTVLAACLRPFGSCASYLSAEIAGLKLGAVADTAVCYSRDLKESDLKDKEIGTVFELMRTLKKLCRSLWQDKVDYIEELYLGTILKMLKAPHYNGRMNAMKEISRLIRDAERRSESGINIHADTVMEWLLNNHILSIGFESNLHNQQYCERLKKVVEFVGGKLTNDELERIWTIQSGKHPTVVDNIHIIISFAAQNFTSDQLQHLIDLIKESWKDGDDMTREKILLLIGKIGRDLRDKNTVVELLDLLWLFTHEDKLSSALISEGVQSHLDVLALTTVVPDAVKQSYVARCITDIQNGQWKVPAVRHMLQNLEAMMKQPYSKGYKALLQDLDKQQDVIKLITTSLIESHQTGLKVTGDGVLSGDTTMPSGYSYGETIVIHLKFIAFILQDGGLYLSWHRVKEIWDCLIADPKNCDGDRETGFEWFTTGLRDLEPETQKSLFTSRFLKFDVHKMSEKGFQCFKAYFESVNENEHKLKKATDAAFVVEKEDLIGLPYLWHVILEASQFEIADDATSFFIQLSSTLLSPKLRKHEQAGIHKRFISECYKRLESLLMLLDKNSKPIVEKTSLFKHRRQHSGFKPDMPRALVITCIERLLYLTCQYISIVEDAFHTTRLFPPHGRCFHGYPLTITAIQESSKEEFCVQADTNETLAMLHQKIAKQMNLMPEVIQLYVNDRQLLSAEGLKLLHQFNFEDGQVVSVRVVAQPSTVQLMPSSLEDTIGSGKASSFLEKERSLPSYLMAVEYKVFDKFYQLAALEEPGITQSLQNLLILIPTDAEVLEALDIFALQNPLSFSPGTRAGIAASSTSVLDNYFNCSAPKMSTFRVLYNLQVLSSKLMPANQADASSSAKAFRENFLTYGGLSLILNILRPAMIPENVEYGLRQSCYYICLQLARFLLCGDSLEPTGNSFTSLHNATSSSATVTHPMMAACATGGGTGSSSSNSQTTSDGMMATSTPIKITRSPHKTSFRHATQASSVPASWPGTRPVTGSPNSAMDISSSPQSNGMVSSSLESSSCITPDAVSDAKRPRAGSMLETVSSTVRMVIETMNKAEFSDMIACLVRVTWAAAAGQLQLNSSSDSLCTVVEDGLCGSSLKAGVCLKQSSVSNMDMTLSVCALELLIMCLQLRTNLLDSLYSLPYAKYFILDILTGSPSVHVRAAAAKQLTYLGDTDVVDTKVQHPRSFLLTSLLKAPLPVWNQSNNTRGNNIRILWQCEEYFELCCNLINFLPAAEQVQLAIDPGKMLLNELTWLQSVDAPGAPLLTGHLKLILALLLCENVDRAQLGKRFIPVLLSKFLFSPGVASGWHPTSSDVIGRNQQESSSLPKCRCAVLNLLSSLADKNPGNFCQISDQLINKYHSNVNSNREWDFCPPVDARPLHGFVGLKNAGATCYMNSVLQQLYMQPGIREDVLKVEDSTDPNPDSIFYHIQSIFGHLLASNMQFYTPDSFWTSFRLWGLPVNVREQQDAFEFFTNITDQLDEHLKGLGKPEIFKRTFSGVFTDQKICKECHHRCEQDEVFSAIPVPVKSRSLEASLQQFVQDEIMEGDNAYFCEKCRERRTTAKRTCIKTLPPVLVIQLKRFWYDWEAGRAIKFDDYFKFPWLLDMEPYTADGIARREHQAIASHADTGAPGGNIFYELVGIVVHSGQASAGHYYSFIRNRSETCGEMNQWYKYNDVSIEEFQMTLENLEAECFGGRYKVKNDKPDSQFPEDRTRYWNGYMLFYESMDKSKCTSGNIPSPFAESPMSSSGSRPSSPGKPDGLTQLSALIKTGERKGLFSDVMPATIRRTIQEENRQFLQNRVVYDEHYFSFVRKLCTFNMRYISDNIEDEDVMPMALTALRLSIKFLFNSYFWTTKQLRSDLASWRACLEALVQCSPHVCLAFYDALRTSGSEDAICDFLVKCPDRETRQMFSELLCFAASAHLRFNNFDAAVTSLLVDGVMDLLDKEVFSHFKQCEEYFGFLRQYAATCPQALDQLIQKGCFAKFVGFLLGPAIRNQEGHVTRRWTPLQTREFASLHILIANIINAALRGHETTGDASDVAAASASDNDARRTLVNVKDVLFGVDSTDRFVWECICATAELPVASDAVTEAMMTCSTDNRPFTVLLLKQTLVYVTGAHANDLKASLHLLQRVLSIQDALQDERLVLVVDGSTQDQMTGILDVIRQCHHSDSRRAYQCIKFLIALANRFPHAKAFLLQNFSRWQWAVDWLKRKMSEYYWTAQPHVTNEKHINSSFQRTVSAQDTLAEATALLIEMDAGIGDDSGLSEPLSSASMALSGADEEDWDKEVDK